jgi:CSLREA domain-containing protein
VPLGDAAGVRAALVFTVNSTNDEVDAHPGDGICRSSAGHCTLRAALNEASALPSDGTPATISVPEGTYVLRIDPPADPLRDEQGGDLDLKSHTVSPPSVTIAGAGAGSTVIEQRRADRVLEVTTTEPVTISNLAIIGGRHVRAGGGVENSAVGGLTLLGVEIRGNSAEHGGGIFSGRPLVVDRSRISDNNATGAGGGLVASVHGGTVTASTISGNTAGQIGGGIWASNVDSLEIVRSLIADNTVTVGSPGIPPYGGGILVGTEPAVGVRSAVRIAYSTIRGNSAGGGGGLAWQGSGTLTVEGSLFASNTAEFGGAIATLSGGGADALNTVTLLNSTLTGNAAERGGAILRSYGDTVLRAATIAGNTAPSGSGLWFNGGRRVYTVATGTIVANEPAEQNCSVNGGAFRPTERLTAPGTNLESGTGCRLGGFDRSSADPLLTALADNGGPTKTRAPSVGSPALDRYTVGDCPATDQRGYSRPAGAACDIGAFERGALLSVDLPVPLGPRQDVTRGLVTLFPSGSFHATSLRGGDYRPCTPGAEEHAPLARSVAGGFFEPRDAQFATRGSLLFSRNEQREVRVGDLLVLLDGTRGRVLALLAPGKGPLPLFDVVGLRYGQKTASGRLHLTRQAARLLNRVLRLNGFRAGMDCGRLAARLSIAPGPASPPPVLPPPPPPPPPPKSFSLRVMLDPSGGGSVESDIGGIKCPTECSTLYAEGTSVKLTAVPADGKAFDNWEGDCRTDSPTCTLTIDADKVVTAKFKERKPQCSDGKDNDGDGAVDYPADKGCSSPSDDSEK